MIHTIIIGHFDIDAIEGGRLVVLRPLDLSVVDRLLREFGEVADDGRIVLGGQRVEFKDGYITCPWLAPARIQCAEEFAKRLCQELGCIVIDRGRREIVPVDRLGPGW